MDTPLVILRAVHILAGVYWAGAVFVVVTFLMKAVADAGPAGGQVMGALIKRRFLDVIPAAALITVLSGLDLYRRTSGRYGTDWIRSPTGMGLSIGAVTGILALLIGAIVGRPNTLQAAALMTRAATMADGMEKAALITRTGHLRARGTAAIQGAAVLLLISVLCMAVSRYL